MTDDTKFDNLDYVYIGLCIQAWGSYKSIRSSSTAVKHVLQDATEWQCRKECLYTPTCLSINWVAEQNACFFIKELHDRKYQDYAINALSVELEVLCEGKLFRQFHVVL